MKLYFIGGPERGSVVPTLTSAPGTPKTLQTLMHFSSTVAWMVRSLSLWGRRTSQPGLMKLQLTSGASASPHQMKASQGTVVTAMGYWRTSYIKRCVREHRLLSAMHGL